MTTGTVDIDGFSRTTRRTEAPPPEIFQSSRTRAGFGVSFRWQMGDRLVGPWAYTREAISNLRKRLEYVFRVYLIILDYQD